MPKGNRVGRILIGRPIVAGSAKGLALVSKEPLSFWGGLCPRTGEIIDRRHERSGTIVTGRVLVFPWGRGSSTSSATLLESIKTRVAPAAIINLKVDPILALGSIVSDAFRLVHSYLRDFTDIADIVERSVVSRPR